jgi:hypothetical protein
MANSEQIKNLERNVVETTQSFGEYVQGLRARNQDRWRAEYRSSEDHQMKRADSFKTSGILMGASAFSGFVGAQFMGAVGPAALAAMTAPAILASAPAVAAAAGAAAGLAMVGKAIYHHIASDQAAKRVAEIQSKTDEQLVEEARRESMSLWDRVVEKARSGAPIDQAETEAAQGDVQRMRPTQG